MPKKVLCMQACSNLDHSFSVIFSLGPTCHFDTKIIFLGGLGAEIFQPVTQILNHSGIFPFLDQT